MDCSLTGTEMPSKWCLAEVTAFARKICRPVSAIFAEQALFLDNEHWTTGGS